MGAIYHYENGDCKLSVYSMREIQMGDLKITKTCALTGSADAMNYSEKQFEFLNELVKKIP